MAVILTLRKDDSAKKLNRLFCICVASRLMLFFHRKRVRFRTLLITSGSDLGIASVSLANHGFCGLKCFPNDAVLFYWDINNKSLKFYFTKGVNET